MVLEATVFERVLLEVAAGKALFRVSRLPGFPSRASVHKFRKLNPDFDARMTAAMGGRRGKPITAERMERVTAQIRSGVPIRRQTVMDPKSIQHVKRRNEAFASQIRGFYIPRGRLSDEVRAARAAERLSRARPYAHRESFLTALRSDEVYALAMAATRNVPDHMADDVRSDLVVQILTGEVQPDDAKVAVRRLCAAWNRSFMHHDRSLDADMGDGRTLGGLIGDPSSWREDSGSRVILPQW